MSLRHLSNPIVRAPFAGSLAPELDAQADGGGMARQATIKTAVHCSGIGLHCGRSVAMSLFPAAAGHGIRFRRTDVGGRDGEVPARWDLVADTNHCTQLRNDDGIGVSTVEHLMAALVGAGIDNVLVVLDGPEVPAMDGSSAPFTFLLDCAGRAVLDAPRPAIEILAPVAVANGDRRATLEPAARFELTVEIDFAAQAIRRQRCHFVLADGSFRTEIARARTFGMLAEVDGLRAAGLALGGSLDNAIVVDGDQVLNAGGLRFEDEFVRHKALDCIGDLALAGAPILGHFRGLRTGHALNNRLLRALFAAPHAWRWTDEAPALPLAKIA